MMRSCSGARRRTSAPAAASTAAAAAAAGTAASWPPGARCGSAAGARQAQASASPAAMPPASMAAAVAAWQGRGRLRPAAGVGGRLFARPRLHAPLRLPRLDAIRRGVPERDGAALWQCSVCGGRGRAFLLLSSSGRSPWAPLLGTSVKARRALRRLAEKATCSQKGRRRNTMRFSIPPVIDVGRPHTHHIIPFPLSSQAPCLLRRRSRHQTHHRHTQIGRLSCG